MITRATIQFLQDLDKNNDRDWFTANKKRYEKEAKAPFEQWVAQIIAACHQFDSSIRITPQDAIFRIYRDTRFSADKTPYKTHLSALISKYGRKNNDYPGFYLQIGPETIWMGGGAYFLEKDPLTKVRRYIVENDDQFEALIKATSFVEKFGEIQGEKNKVVPLEFRDEVKRQALIANKQFYYMAELPVEQALRADSVAWVAAYFEAGKPLNDFVTAALAGG